MRATNSTVVRSSTTCSCWTSSGSSSDVLLLLEAIVHPKGDVNQVIPISKAFSQHLIVGEEQDRVVVPFGGADSSLLAPPLHHINRKKKEGHTLLRTVLIV
jgi:hypothetical protein